MGNEQEVSYSGKYAELLRYELVDYYGTPTVLHQVANIRQENNDVIIQPWEREMLGPIKVVVQKFEDRYAGEPGTIALRFSKKVPDQN